MNDVAPNHVAFGADRLSGPVKGVRLRGEVKCWLKCWLAGQNGARHEWHVDKSFFVDFERKEIRPRETPP